MRPTLLWSLLLLLGVFAAAAAAPPAQLTLETYQEWCNDSAATHGKTRRWEMVNWRVEGGIMVPKDVHALILKSP
ncbi:IFNGR2 isoform 2 [Pan troglodytes]|uniref:IFNGR2 isoform 2 n=1 Tax=Pan troglodytes TaxID=9598 RepID=A0A2J8M7A2_PANTR|nr:IFNGR2 isoform 2 [Pan troglodytes]